MSWIRSDSFTGDYTACAAGRSDSIASYCALRNHYIIPPISCHFSLFGQPLCIYILVISGSPSPCVIQKNSHPYSVFWSKKFSIHSRYASSGTPHLLWNQRDASFLSSGSSLNVILRHFHIYKQDHDHFPRKVHTLRLEFWKLLFFHKLSNSKYVCTFCIYISAIHPLCFYSHSLWTFLN